MSYAPFQNQPEYTETRQSDMNDAYPEMNMDTNSGNDVENSRPSHHSHNKGAIVFSCFGRPFHSKSIAILLIFFNLVAHIAQYGRKLKMKPRDYDYDTHDYDTHGNETLGPKNSETENIENGMTALWHFQVWVEGLLSVFAIYGIVKNSARHVHWYILWCCFETATEVLVIMFFVYLVASITNVVMAFNLVFLFMLFIPVFSLVEIYFLLVHYRFLRSTYAQSNVSLLDDIRQKINNFRQ